MDSERLKRVVVLSPHPDDAVLSAWHALVPGALVITVFAGIPPNGTRTILDTLHGATDSPGLMSQRITDDETALSFAGVSSVRLGFFDAQYRFRPDAELVSEIVSQPQHFASLVKDHLLAKASDELVDQIAQTVLRFTGRDCVLYGPLAVGGHPDHVAIMRVCRRLSNSIEDVRLYADTPYFLRHGAPSWISGGHEPDADQFISRHVELAYGAETPARSAIVLTEEQTQRKIKAIHLYETEIAHLASGYPHIADPGRMRHEAFWRWTP